MFLVAPMGLLTLPYTVRLAISEPLEVWLVVLDNPTEGFLLFLILPRRELREGQSQQRAANRGPRWQPWWHCGIMEQRVAMATWQPSWLY